METGRRCISLAKGRHRFIFQYRHGQEPGVLASLVGLARSPKSDFNWLDAALLSFQLGKRIGTFSDRQAAMFL